MKSSVQVSRGIESLFGTQDENIRLIEVGLNVRTKLGSETIEIDGEQARPWWNIRSGNERACVHVLGW